MFPIPPKIYFNVNLFSFQGGSLWCHCIEYSRPHLHSVPTTSPTNDRHSISLLPHSTLLPTHSSRIKTNGRYRNFLEISYFVAVSRSPIFSHFSESASGVGTIRAYRRQRDFHEEFMKRVDDNEQCFYWHFAVNRW
jgi:hypothetical protein